MRSVFHRLRALVVGATDSSIDDREEPSVETPTEPTVIDRGALPRHFGSSDPAEVSRALGHLVGMPSLSRTQAKELVPVLVERIEERHAPDQSPDRSGSSTTGFRRAGYRALRRIAVEYPGLVTPHAPGFVHDLQHYHLQVRDSCAELFVVLLEHEPELASLVYSGLIRERTRLQEVALEVLVSAADTRPIVLAPLSSYLLEQASNPSVNRELVAIGLERLGRVRPEVRNAAAADLIDWLPVTDEETEDAVIRVLLASHPDDHEAQVERAEVLLRHLDRSGDRLRAAVIDRLLADARADSAVDAAIEAWIASRDAPTRRRTRAWFDEAGERE